jgi:peptide/nickel transport system permease protein
VGPLLLKALDRQDMFLAGTSCSCSAVMTVIGTLHLRHPARLDRPAHPARGDVMADPRALDPDQRPRRPSGPPREQRIFVASQWQLMWWRFRKHKLAVASASWWSASTWSSWAPTFLAYADPNASEAQRSLMPPQRVYWFDGWRFAPYVHGFKGARDPQTFKRVYGRIPSVKVPIRFFAEASSTHLGVIPPRAT